MLVQPYLNFAGRCEEALEFYRSALGAEVTMLMRFQDMPETPPPGSVPAGAEKKVMLPTVTAEGGRASRVFRCR